MQSNHVKQPAMFCTESGCLTKFQIRTKLARAIICAWSHKKGGCFIEASANTGLTVLIIHMGTLNVTERQETFAFAGQSYLKFRFRFLKMFRNLLLNIIFLFVVFIPIRKIILHQHTTYFCIHCICMSDKNITNV